MLIHVDPDLPAPQDSRFYRISIPRYRYNIKQDTIYYEIHLWDYVHNKEYTKQVRFNELKKYHELNYNLQLQLPEFPRTHFWTKTNDDPKLIQNRRSLLEKYFDLVVDDPYARGTLEVGLFIDLIKNTKFSKNKDKRSVRSCQKWKDPGIHYQQEYYRPKDQGQQQQATIQKQNIKQQQKNNESKQNKKKTDSDICQEKKQQNQGNKQKSKNRRKLIKKFSSVPKQMGLCYRNNNKNKGLNINRNNIVSLNQNISSNTNKSKILQYTSLKN